MDVRWGIVRVWERQSQDLRQLTNHDEMISNVLFLLEQNQHWHFDVESQECALRLLTRLAPVAKSRLDAVYLLVGMLKRALSSAVAIPASKGLNSRLTSVEDAFAKCCTEFGRVSSVFCRVAIQPLFDLVGHQDALSNPSSIIWYIFKHLSSWTELPHRTIVSNKCWDIIGHVSKQGPESSVNVVAMSAALRVLVHINDMPTGACRLQMSRLISDFKTMFQSAMRPAVKLLSVQCLGYVFRRTRDPRLLTELDSFFTSILQSNSCPLPDRVMFYLMSLATTRSPTAASRTREEFHWISLLLRKNLRCETPQACLMQVDLADLPSIDPKVIIQSIVTHHLSRNKQCLVFLARIVVYGQDTLDLMFDASHGDLDLMARVAGVLPRICHTLGRLDQIVSRMFSIVSSAADSLDDESAVYRLIRTYIALGALSKSIFESKIASPLRKLLRRYGQFQESVLHAHQYDIYTLGVYALSRGLVGMAYTLFASVNSSSYPSTKTTDGGLISSTDQNGDSVCARHLRLCVMWAMAEKQTMVYCETKNIDALYQAHRCWVEASQLFDMVVSHIASLRGDRVEMASAVANVGQVLALRKDCLELFLTMMLYSDGIGFTLSEWDSLKTRFDGLGSQYARLDNVNPEFQFVPYFAAYLCGLLAQNNVLPPLSPTLSQLGLQHGDCAGMSTGTMTYGLARLTILLELDALRTKFSGDVKRGVREMMCRVMLNFPFTFNPAIIGRYF